MNDFGCGQHNNGMHPTPNERACYQYDIRGAGDAERSAFSRLPGIWNGMNHEKFIYRLGDMVRIKAAPFAPLTGKVEGIHQSKTLLKVTVEIFGRVTPIKVNFSEAEKLEFQRRADRMTKDPCFLDP